MIARRILTLAAALVLAPLPSVVRADPCLSGDTALDAAINQAALDAADLEITRGLMPDDPERLGPMLGEIARHLTHAFDLTPQREHLLIYTQTPAGLCALVFDGVTVIDTAARPGQTPDKVTAARLGLLDALDVDARQAQRAGKFRGAVALDSAPPIWAEPPADAAARLADVLMLPDLAPSLIGAEEILILPTNDIGTVPFSLLPLGGGMMIDVAPITIVPSAAALFDDPRDLSSEPYDMWSILGAQRTTSPVAFTPVWTGAVIVGDPSSKDDPDWAFPPLPGARTEALAISARLGVTPMIGEAATPAAVLEALTRPADLVYFAAHGVSSDEEPLTDSFLALSGGRLTTGEVQDLHLQSRPLVVLSACQTGLGQSHAGGTIGLGRAFVLAGASAVVSTVWNVDDLATKELMEDFVANLAVTRPSAALRGAMLAARSRNPDDPALWAGVMLFGGLSILAD